MLYTALNDIKANINNHSITCKRGDDIELTEFEANVLQRGNNIVECTGRKVSEIIAHSQEDSEAQVPQKESKKRGRKKKDS